MAFTKEGLLPPIRQTRQVLVDARGYLERPGWWQQGKSWNWNYDDDHLEVCALGAVFAAAIHGSSENVVGMSSDDFRRRNQLASVKGGQGAVSCLQSALDGLGMGVPSFNDEAGRQLAEVLALFDRAIERITARIDQYTAPREEWTPMTKLAARSYTTCAPTPETVAAKDTDLVLAGV